MSSSCAGWCLKVVGTGSWGGRLGFIIPVLACDQHCGLGEVTEHLCARVRRPLTTDNIMTLLRGRAEPLGGTTL
jgi:hypothetical protein